jgi:hypothetical protein
VTPRDRLLTLNDRLIACLFVTLVLGASLAFGAHVDWALPCLVVFATLLVLAVLARGLLEGTWAFLKSPLPFVGLLALGLALIQLLPFNPAIAERISPRSQQVYAIAAASDTSGEMVPSTAEAGASPVTLDRSATLRWLVVAAVCAAVFWAAGLFADRFGHLAVVWASVVVALGLNTVVGSVQLLAHQSGLWGSIEPGSGSAAGPTLDNVWTAPGSHSVLRLADLKGDGPSWAVPRLGAPFSLGTMIGGPGAYLALAALGLPLALALALQLAAPRGSREPLMARLIHSSHAGPFALLIAVVGVGAFLVGLLAGPWLSLPFALGLALAGLPAARPSGFRNGAIGLTLGALGLMALGVLLGAILPEHQAGASPLAERRSLAASTTIWSDSIRIVGDFPRLGIGAGSFPSVYPAYMSQDRTVPTAQSSVLQWAAETGLAGLVLLTIASVWCLLRLPAAIRSVGTADRFLPFGLVGSCVCMGLFAVFHWSVELTAVALAASAVGGTLDRWLAGGTDLFV